MSGDETYLRDNAGTARLLGADLAARHRIGSQGSPWSVEGTLSYAWGQQYDDTVDPNSGEEPYYDVPFRRIPPLFGRGKVTVNWENCIKCESCWRAEPATCSGAASRTTG